MDHQRYPFGIPDITDNQLSMFNWMVNNDHLPDTLSAFPVLPPIAGMPRHPGIPEYTDVRVAMMPLMYHQQLPEQQQQCALIGSSIRMQQPIKSDNESQFDLDGKFQETAAHDTTPGQYRDLTQSRRVQLSTHRQKQEYDDMDVSSLDCLCDGIMEPMTDEDNTSTEEISNHYQSVQTPTESTRIPTQSTRIPQQTFWPRAPQQSTWSPPQSPLRRIRRRHKSPGESPPHKIRRRWKSAMESPRPSRKIAENTDEHHWKNVRNWSVDDVSKWVRSLGTADAYEDCALNFRMLQIDGEALANFSKRQLDMCVSDVLQCHVIWGKLQRLLTQPSSHIHSGSGATSIFSSNTINPESLNVQTDFHPNYTPTTSSNSSWPSTQSSSLLSTTPPTLPPTQPSTPSSPSSSLSTPSTSPISPPISPRISPRNCSRKYPRNSPRTLSRNSPRNSSPTSLPSSLPTSLPSTSSSTSLLTSHTISLLTSPPRKLSRNSPRNSSPISLPSSPPTSLPSSPSISLLISPSSSPRNLSRDSPRNSQSISPPSSPSISPPSSPSISPPSSPSISPPSSPSISPPSSPSISPPSSPSISPPSSPSTLPRNSPTPPPTSPSISSSSSTSSSTPSSTSPSTRPSALPSTETHDVSTLETSNDSNHHSQKSRKSIACEACRRARRKCSFVKTEKQTSSCQRCTKKKLECYAQKIEPVCHQNSDYKRRACNQCKNARRRCSLMITGQSSQPCDRCTAKNINCIVPTKRNSAVVKTLKEVEYKIVFSDLDGLRRMADLPESEWLTNTTAKDAAERYQAVHLDSYKHILTEDFHAKISNHDDVWFRNFVLDLAITKKLGPGMLKKICQAFHVDPECLKHPQLRPPRIEYHQKQECSVQHAANLEQQTYSSPAQFDNWPAGCKVLTFKYTCDETGPLVQIEVSQNRAMEELTGLDVASLVHLLQEDLVPMAGRIIYEDDWPHMARLHCGQILYSGRVDTVTKSSCIMRIRHNEGKVTACACNLAMRHNKYGQVESVSWCMMPLPGQEETSSSSRI